MRLMNLAFVVVGVVLPACAAVDDPGAPETDSSAESQLKQRVAWQLDAGTDEGGNSIVSVSHTDGSGLHQDGSCQAESCPFPFLDGAVVHVSVAPVDDGVNCELFHHWIGACAGQGASCTFTIHSNVSTEAIYVLKRGCGGS